MNKSRKFKINTAIIIAACSFAAVFAPAHTVKADTVTGGTGIAGISQALSDFYSDETTTDEEKLSLLLADYEIPEDIAIANVNNQLNVRSGPGTSNSRVGLLDNGDACIVISVDGEWAKVKSGTIEGYVFYEYLLTGDTAKEYIRSHCKPCIQVKNGITNLNIRSEASTSSQILSKAQGGTYLPVINDCVVNKEEDENKVWVEVEYSKGKTGFVSADYVLYTYSLSWAEKYSPYGPGVSDLRCNLCDYAKQFIGTKYVWGGNDLYKGIDCSGFVKKVYAHFGYTTPRVSRDMARKYTKIKKEDLKPGDLVFYGTKDGYINHVAMYIGNDKIIHSSSNYNGIAISSMYFYNIICYERIIKD